MNTLVVKQNGRELGRSLLNKSSLLIGKSSACDISVRNPKIAYFHFLVENVLTSTDQKTPSFWTVIDISESKNQNHSGEGIIISADPKSLKGYEFSLIQDDLAESDLSRGVVKRSLDDLSSKKNESFGSDLLEVIHYQKDVDSVVQILHLPKSHLKSPYPVAGQNYALRILWQAQNLLPSLILKPNDFSRGLSLFNKGEDLSQNLNLAAAPIEIKSGDFYQIEDSKYIIYIRTVANARVKTEKLSWLKDPLVIMLGLSLVFSWAMYLNFKSNSLTEKPKAKSAEQRLVKINVALPAPPKIEEKQLNPNLQLKSALSEQSKIEKKIEMTKKTVEAPKVNTTTNVDSMGLLGQIDDDVEQSVPVHAKSQNKAPSLATGKTGFGLQKKEMSGSDTDFGSLKSAGSGLSKAQVGDSTQLDSDTDSLQQNFSENGPQFQTMDQFQVIGALSKMEVKEKISSRKQKIQKCYENALLIDKSLKGQLALKWKILTNGQVEALSVAGSTIQSIPFISCLEDQIRSLNFGAKPAPTYVLYPWVFK